MSRVIKFRAWNKYDKKFYPESAVNRIELGSFEELKASGFVFMQFTGLLDRDGKEIYEGDIIKLRGIREGAYRNRDRIIVIKRVGDERAIFQDGYYGEASKVLGNIYEHSHLVEARPDGG